MRCHYSLNLFTRHRPGSRYPFALTVAVCVFVTLLPQTSLAHKAPAGLDRLACVSLRTLAGQGVAVTMEPGADGSSIQIDFHRNTLSSQALELVAQLQAPMRLTFFPGVALDDAMCRQIASMRHLVSLELHKVVVTPQGLVHITASRGLRSLALHGLNLSNTDLRAFGCLGTIRRLRIDSAVLSDDNWNAIGTAASLQELSCEGVPLTPVAWDAIRGLPALESMQVGGKTVVQADIEAMSQIPRLREVKVQSARLTADWLEPLAKLPNCTSLDLSHSRLDEDCLLGISKVAGLRELYLNFTALRGTHLDALHQLRELSTLGLSDTRLDDINAQKLSNCARLSCLTLSSPNITDRGFLALAELTDLHELRVSGVQLSDSIFTTVSRLDQLRELTAYDIPITDDGAAQLERLQHLEELRLRYYRPPACALIGIRGMSSLGRVAALRILEISGVRQTPESMVPLVHLRALKTLIMNDAQIDDRMLRVASQLIALRELRVAGSQKFGDGAVDLLFEMPDLEVLAVDDRGLSADAMTRLKKRFVVDHPCGTFTITGADLGLNAEGLLYIQDGTFNDASSP